MQFLFEGDLFRSVFKYFSFKQNKEQVRRVYYQNAVFEGECVLEPSRQVYTPQGLGILLTNRGDIFYGKFDDGKISGEGNCLLANGGFLRGCFRENRANGNFVYITFSGDIYIMTFREGLLHGNCTFFPASFSCAFTLLFMNNHFYHKIKNYEFPVEKYSEVKKAILREIFEGSQMNDLYLKEKDVGHIIKKRNKEGTEIGTFEIGQHDFIFNGVFDSSLEFCGLGILLEIGKRIEFGFFSGPKIDNFGSIFDGNFLYTGFLKDGQLHSRVIVMSVRKKAWKLCRYDKGALIEVIQSGNQDTRPPALFENFSKNDIEYFFSDVEDRNESEKGALNFVYESFSLNFFDEFVKQWDDIQNFAEGQISQEVASQPQNFMKKANHDVSYDEIKNSDEQKFTFQPGTKRANAAPPTRSKSSSITDKNTNRNNSPYRLTLKLKEKSENEILTHHNKAFKHVKAKTTKGPFKGNLLSPETSFNFTSSDDAILNKIQTMKNTSELSQNDKKAKATNGELHKNVCWDFDEYHKNKKQMVSDAYFKSKTPEKNYINK